MDRYWLKRTGLVPILARVGIIAAVAAGILLAGARPSFADEPINRSRGCTSGS